MLFLIDYADRDRLQPPHGLCRPYRRRVLPLRSVGPRWYLRVDDLTAFLNCLAEIEQNRGAIRLKLLSWYHSESNELPEIEIG